jgi:uncharacterized membrane protein
VPPNSAKSPVYRLTPPGRVRTTLPRRSVSFPCSGSNALRYLLAIGGLLVGAAAIVGVVLVIPGGRTPASAAAVAQPAAPGAAEAEAETAEGSLRVCNQTANTISIALGYKAERGWQSEGWWVADPGDCRSVYNGVLDARYYYIYAADDIGGGSWDGNFFLCTRDETFTIFGVEDCLARGYERTGFFEVDTQNRSNWMIQLTDNEVLGAEPIADIEEAEPFEGDFDPDDDAQLAPETDPDPEGEAD